MSRVIHFLTNMVLVIFVLGASLLLLSYIELSPGLAAIFGPYQKSIRTLYEDFSQQIVVQQLKPLLDAIETWAEDFWKQQRLPGSTP